MESHQRGAAILLTGGAARSVLQSYTETFASIFPISYFEMEKQEKNCCLKKVKGHLFYVCSNKVTKDSFASIFQVDSDFITCN